MINEPISYTDSKYTEIPWLNKIPGHWETSRAKALYSKANRPVRDTDEVVTCFRDGTVTLRKNRRTTGFTESINESGYQGIRKGDLVIHVMDAFAGAIGVSDSDGKGTPVYSVCVPKVRLNNYYFAYVIREMAKTGFIQSLYRGIRERSSDFRFDVFANQVLPIPPLEEQNQIVKYLDNQLSKINKFIKAKKKLIAVLKVQKQAVINQAVTKGITLDVKMKPSGIEWLGNIPEHWDIMRLPQIAEVTLSGVDKKSYDNQKAVLLCNYVDVYKNDFITNDIEFMKATASDEEIRKLSLYKGDVVLTKDSESWDDIAIPSFVKEELNNVICAYHLAVVRNKSQSILSEFLYYIFLSQYMAVQYKVKAKGVTRYGLSYQAIRDVTLFVPSLEEQQKIIHLIATTIADIDETIAKTQKEIDLILEYRTRLIADVVTGKVDVRGIVVEDAIGEISDLNESETEDLESEELTELEEVEV